MRLTPSSNSFHFSSNVLLSVFEMTLLARSFNSSAWIRSGSFFSKVDFTLNVFLSSGFLQTFYGVKLS